MGERAHWELQQFATPKGCQVEACPASPKQLFLSLEVGEGPYMPATLVFWIKIFDDYPAEGSFSIRCTKRIFHPSVDQSTGHIDLQESQLNSASPTNRLQA